MAQELNIRQFLRRAPRDWLRRYFEREGALASFDWNTLGKRNVEPLAKAWLELDADTRGRMLDDFSNIKLLATPAGKMQMIDEAAYHDVQREVAEALGSFEDFYDCAFWLKLEHPECWDGAVHFAAADSRSGRNWRKRINMPWLGREATYEDGKALAAAITDIFRRNEGRGDHCFVEQFMARQSG